MSTARSGLNEDSKNEQTSLITLESLAGNSASGKTYSNAHVDFTLTKPWTIFGLGQSTSDQVQIYCANVLETQQDSLRSTITEERVYFKFLTTCGNEKKKEGTLYFMKNDLLAAIQNAAALENGERGVSLKKTFIGSKFLANTRDDAMFLNFFFGSGHGTRAVEMIFDKAARLDRIKIYEDYRSTTTLFLAKNLRSDVEIRAEQQQRSNLADLAKQQAEEGRKFKF